LSIGTTQPRDGMSRRKRFLCTFAAATLTLVVTATWAGGGPEPGKRYHPGVDANSLASTTRYIGAREWWAAGYTGKGVDVAVIDTGVTPVEGLRGPDKLVHGPDLSAGQGAFALAGRDAYGHGTFMAGLIAGRDGPPERRYDEERASSYIGMAPDSRIVSIKVGAADGATNVSQVVAAIDWAVRHAHDPGLNIRVLNLSYTAHPKRSYVADPLALAVERAWKQGIVVVAAAGNASLERGARAAGLAAPAYDPFVVAVGASDSMGTSARSDDRVPGFSRRAECATCRRPDLVAPGSHLQGLRVPGSRLDASNPEARLGGRYFRGSGTSQSAAITSGAVALVLDRYPELTPDLVKRYLEDTAIGSGAAPARAGAGLLRLELGRVPDLSAPAQSHAPALGDCSVPAVGGGAPTRSLWAGRSWSGSSWSGSSWSGSSWS
jgi:serine protease AprX